MERSSNVCLKFPTALNLKHAAAFEKTVGERLTDRLAGRNDSLFDYGEAERATADQPVKYVVVLLHVAFLHPGSIS